MSNAKVDSHSFYWKIWGILLVVTLVMIFIDRPAASALASADTDGASGLLVLVLLVAMAAKATLISSYFMHLRFERLFLGAAVFFGLLINGVILYVLILPDGKRIFEMLSP